MGPQLAKEGDCHIARCWLCAVGFPSCFSSDFPGDTETGLEWQSDSCLSVLEQLRAEVRNAEEGLFHSGATEACHFSIPRG